MHDRTAAARRILYGCGAIIIILIGITIWRALVFHMISINPPTKKVSTISPFIRINFSQNLSSDNLHVASSPAGSIGTPTVSGKVLTIPLKPPLKSGKTYTITLVSVTSVNGGKITNKSFRFTPVYIASSDLPADQQQALLKQQTDTGPGPSDPILKHLPYKTTDFTLTANQAPAKNSSKLFPLSAIITLSQADTGNKATAVAQYKQEIANYIASLGLDPNNYAITYVVQTP